jgi:hypothetical protein
MTRPCVACIRLAVGLFLALCISSHAAGQTMPPHAHKGFIGGWECDRGYREQGNACVAVVISAHAHLNFLGSGWECDRGFREESDGCVRLDVPPNAHINFLGSGWDCDRGFRQAENSCVRFVVPPNASLDFTGNSWQCKQGFKQQGDSCMQMTAVEIAAEQKALQEFARARAAAAIRVDSVNWSECQDALDRLRRAASSASDAAEQANSSKSELTDCHEYPQTYDINRDRCQSQASDYESHASEVTSELDTVASRIKAVNVACGQ